MFGNLDTAHLNTQVMLSVESFNFTWLIGILLIISALGYLIDSLANIILPNYNDYKDILTLIVIIPGIAGELSFTIWLLLKGFKNKL